MPYPERDWRLFWETHREPESGVYGPANSVLLEYARRFTEHKAGLSALDVGCGDGRYTIPLASMGYTVTAVDKSEVAIQRLKERVSVFDPSLQINTENADIFDIINRKRFYDLIVCSGFIEEIPQGKHKELILGLQKWTKFSGMNILRYVIEKKFSLDGEADVVSDHNYLENLYNDWDILRSEIEPNFRQAKVGRVINGQMINRFFRAATIVAIKNSNGV